MGSNEDEEMEWSCDGDNILQYIEEGSFNNIVEGAESLRSTAMSKPNKWHFAMSIV